MDKIKTAYADSKKKKVKGGMHKMPDGKMMKNSDMKKPTKKPGKK